MISFHKPKAEQFFQTTIIQQFAVNADETQLMFSSNMNGAFNIWGMDLPHTFPYPLTFINQNCHGIHYTDNADFAIVSFDEDGDENSQLYAMPPEGGQLVPLRTGEGERHFFGSLSDDGKRLYYTTTRDNATFLNTYCYDMEKNTEKRIIEGSGGATYFAARSPEEQTIAFIRHFANTYVLGYLLKGEKEVQLTPESEAQHTVSDIVFTSEQDVYLLTNYREDFTYLAHFDVEKEQFTKLMDAPEGEFSSLHFDKDREKLYLSTSLGVEDRLYMYGLKEETLDKIKIPVDVIEQITVGKSGSVYLMGRRAIEPFNIFKLAHEAEDWDRLTSFKVPGIAEESLVDPDIIRYPSYDGLEIEALYFKAKPDVDNGYLIHWPHGGPQASERKMFRALFQLLLNRGYSIFAPNFRGSTGYGLSFMKMVEGDWGYGPRLDNVKAIDYMIEQGYADKDKILLMGGSYGGYMALLLHGRHADYYQAVVDIFGVSNLFSFVASVPEHWKPVMKQWVGDPEADKAKFTEDTPITYLDSMTKPMLVIQGANDPRVVKAESDQIVEALKEKGSTVEYIVLEDEGHGFSKKENEINVYKSVLAFFEKYTKK